MNPRSKKKKKIKSSRHLSSHKSLAQELKKVKKK